MSRRNAATDPLMGAAKDLLYPSESDEPFEPFSWGAADGELTPAKARQLTKAAPKAAVQQVSLDDFFKSLTSEEADDAEKFKALRKAVEDQLAAPRVFRIGKVNIDIYVVGKTKDGEWAGLKTKSVET